MRMSLHVFSPSPERESDSLAEESQEQLPLISAVLNTDNMNVDVPEVNDVVPIIESPKPVEENDVEDREAIPVSNDDADLITVSEGDMTTVDMTTTNLIKQTY